MLTETTHEMITGSVEYIAYLDDMRKRALVEFYEYCHKLEKEKKNLEQLKRESPCVAALTLI